MLKIKKLYIQNHGQEDLGTMLSINVDWHTKPWTGRLRNDAKHKCWLVMSIRNHICLLVHLYSWETTNTMYLWWNWLGWGLLRWTGEVLCETWPPVTQRLWEMASKPL